MVHNPGYDFNDANITTGSAYWVLLAERYLAPKADARAADAQPAEELLAAH